MPAAEYEDPRLVQLYDLLNRWGRDDDLFVSVVGEHGPARVLDLGCGTGRLTTALAAAGHTVTGVEPARASLDVARARPGGDRVTWLTGTSAVAPAGAFDVAVMSSHVAQVFIDDDAWQDTLDDLARALVPGGRLVFDSRDPAARAWERWHRPHDRDRVPLPGGGVAEVWSEVHSVGAGIVDFAMEYHLPGAGRLTSAARLRFRTEAELRSSLTGAGLTVEHVYGGWGREPVGAGDGELVVVARAGVRPGSRRSVPPEDSSTHPGSG